MRHNQNTSTLFANAQPLFAFDLDGTITREEMLPRLAARLGLEREIAALTAQTLSGAIPFEASFRRRFQMLRRLPLSVIHEEVSAIGLDEAIANFIRKRPEDCVIVTGNLDRWIQPLVTPLGCRVLCSVSRPADNKDIVAPDILRHDDGRAVAAVPLNPAQTGQVATGRCGRAVAAAPLKATRNSTDPGETESMKSVMESVSVFAGAGELELVSVLDKGEALRELRALGRPLVAIGESVSDIAMFRAADLGLAFAGVHNPVPELLTCADRVFDCGRSLCAFLEELGK